MGLTATNLASDWAVDERGHLARARAPGRWTATNLASDWAVDERGHLARARAPGRWTATNLASAREPDT